MANPAKGKSMLADASNKALISSQQSLVSDLTVSASAGTLPTPDGSITIADAATPTVVELQEFCVELNAKLNAALDVLEAHGLMADA